MLVRLSKLLSCLLVAKTIVIVLRNFPDYFPPNFQADFLLGRHEYFFGVYQWAFYGHILAGPVTLAIGIVLLNQTVRRRWPQWHRGLGKFQVACVVFFVCPSGLWMAWYALTGIVAGVGFATLAILTALCAVKGWRAAVQRRFNQHRDWMLRCYVLLCAAVVLRVIGGAAEVLNIEGTYPWAAWLSWVVPLAVLEWIIRTNPK